VGKVKSASVGGLGCPPVRDMDKARTISPVDLVTL
jgi:hypothetical protein